WPTLSSSSFSLSYKRPSLCLTPILEPKEKNMNLDKQHSSITFIVAILGAFLLCSCESTSNYQSEARPDLASKSYKTFAVLPVLPKDDHGPREVADAMRIGPVIEEAIASAMIAKGYERVPVEEADLNLRFFDAFSEKIEIYEWGPRYPVHPVHYSRYGWIVDYPRRDVQVENYEEGNVAVEAFDRETKEIVWIGWREIRKPSKTPKANRVMNFFQNIMANFPNR
ncbi:MAG: DUF4136 domain-containing protein, partial [Verrucomicrobiota bacterium]